MGFMLPHMITLLMSWVSPLVLRHRQINTTLTLTLIRTRTQCITFEVGRVSRYESAGSSGFYGIIRRRFSTAATALAVVATVVKGTEKNVLFYSQIFLHASVQCMPCIHMCILRFLLSFLRNCYLIVLYLLVDDFRTVFPHRWQRLRVARFSQWCSFQHIAQMLGVMQFKFIYLCRICIFYLFFGFSMHFL